MRMRDMIKFRKTDNCVSLQVIRMDKSNVKRASRSDNFYLLKTELSNLLETGETIISKDIHSFAVVSMRDNVIYFDMTWLESNGHQVKGYIDHIKIDKDKFVEWYFSDSQSYKTLTANDRRYPIINVNSREVLKKVVETPILRKKFSKIVSRFLNYDCDEIEIYDDWADYSFGWTEWRNNKRTMFGGLIFHKNYNEPDNLMKGYYQIHT